MARRDEMSERGNTRTRYIAVKAKIEIGIKPLQILVKTKYVALDVEIAHVVVDSQAL
jgi:hypothetical protein